MKKPKKKTANYFEVMEEAGRETRGQSDQHVEAGNTSNWVAGWSWSQHQRSDEPNSPVDRSGHGTTSKC